jgi:acetyl-CoA carboxylase biotin carboxyl carrier protein
MALSDDDVREILGIIDESELDELRIETAGFSLYVRRGGDAAGSLAPAAAAPAALPLAARVSPQGDSVAPAELAGTETVGAPMLGTFYRAEAPGAEPFVELGATVAAETTVCIIEVMKMMNAIPAGVSGTIVEICAENGALVEYGQSLFRVRAD